MGRFDLDLGLMAEEDGLDKALLGSEVVVDLAERDLGGFRKARPDSRHTALRNAGFRGYADHMETEAFRTARDRLVDMAREVPTASMCAESLWWRCHRRMLSDSLTAIGCDVRHVMEGGKQQPHRLSAAARLEDGALVYDVPEGQQELLAE